MTAGLTGGDARHDDRRAGFAGGGGSLIERIASDSVIDQAYAWVCQWRASADEHADVWHLRMHWERERAALQRALVAGVHEFEPVRLCETSDGGLGVWSARDALVLKAMTLVLQEALGPVLSEDYYHLAGRSGLKGAVRAVCDAVGAERFVYRTDVKGYYASIDHACLMREVRGLVRDCHVLGLIERFLEHMVDEDGALRPVHRGISLGSPLSLLLGAVCICMGWMRR